MKHTNHFVAILSLSFFVALISGCGDDKIPFGGKVTLPDGTPFTRGYVCFNMGNYAARGELQPDGSYVLGSLKDADGLPPGTYQVYLSGYQENTGTDDNPILRSDIALKYDSPQTSGLSCKVVKGGRFDFVVEPFSTH